MTYELKHYDGTALVDVEPLESDGTYSLSVPRAILDINFGSTNEFVVADDVSSRFIAGFTFYVTT